MTKAKYLLGTVYIIVSIFSIHGCGYFMSGSWEDDPDNWGRAFNSIKPDYVEVVHSLYTRMPHWSYEYEYFFEIEKNIEFREQLISSNSLIQIRLHNNNFFFNSKIPKWFVPKGYKKYKMYVFEKDDFSNFRFFEDIENGKIYLYDYQI